VSVAHFYVFRIHVVLLEGSSFEPFLKNLV
jgi:hypothetical protein